MADKTFEKIDSIQSQPQPPSTETTATITASTRSNQSPVESSFSAMMNFERSDDDDRDDFGLDALCISDDKLGNGPHFITFLIQVPLINFSLFFLSSGYFHFEIRLS